MQKSPKFKLAEGYSSMVTLSSGNITKDVYPGQVLIGEQWRRYVNLGILKEQLPDQAAMSRPAIPPPPIPPAVSSPVSAPVVAAVPADPAPLAEVLMRDDDTSPAEPVAEPDALAPQESVPEVLGFSDPVVEPEPVVVFAPVAVAPTFVEPLVDAAGAVRGGADFLVVLDDVALVEPVPEVVSAPMIVEEPVSVPEAIPETELPKPDDRYVQPVSPSRPKRGRPRKQR